MFKITYHSLIEYIKKYAIIVTFRNIVILICVYYNCLIFTIMMHVSSGFSSNIDIPSIKDISLIKNKNKCGLYLIETAGSNTKI